MRGRLRTGALLACVGILGAGLYLALQPPAPPVYDVVKTRLGDIRTEAVPGVSITVDRYRYLAVNGAACSDYYYRDSWARSVGLPTLIDVNAGEPITIYAPWRSCAGANAGGHGRVLALLYAGHLFATDEYRHPPSNPFAGLPAGLLLLVIGTGGVLLLLWRR